METFVNINGKGDFVLKVNGQEVTRVAFSEDNQEALSLEINEYIA